MKTKNLELTLMNQGQQNKEVFFNETIGIIDSFLSNSIEGFVESEPSDAFKNQKFILTDGLYKNHICFSSFPDRSWSFISPKIGMSFFCISLRNFVFFDGDSWVINDAQLFSAVGAGAFSAPTSITSREISPKFVGANNNIEIMCKINFLYMEGDTCLCLKSNLNSSVDIIVKQNYEAIFNLSFDSPILWNNDTAYNLSSEHNVIDYIRLVKLPETEHYLGQIIHQAYKY